MAQLVAWIQLYDLLALGQPPADDLVQECLNSRNGLGETMLHWYAIEGESFVLERILSLGFEVNTQNIFGNTPIMEAALIGRWDNVKVLQNHGARLDICNQEGQDYWAYLAEFGIVVPEGIFHESLVDASGFGLGSESGPTAGPGLPKPGGGAGPLAPSFNAGGARPG